MEILIYHKINNVLIKQKLKNTWGSAVVIPRVAYSCPLFPGQIGIDEILSKRKSLTLIMSEAQMATDINRRQKLLKNNRFIS